MSSSGRALKGRLKTFFSHKSKSRSPSASNSPFPASHDPAGAAQPSTEPPVTLPEEAPPASNTKRSADLWEQAFERLQSDDPGIVQDYEKFLVSESISKGNARTKVLRDSNEARGIDRAEQLNQVLNEQRQILEDERWKVKLGRRQFPIQEMMKKIASLVITAKDLVSSALSTEPQAAVAWAGVAVLLAILIESTKQEAEAVNGLGDIGDLLLRYRILQDVYLDDCQLANEPDVKKHELWSKWRTNTIKLYQFILGYQFKLVGYFCRSAPSRFVRNSVKADDWKSLLAEIQKISKTGEQHKETLQTYDIKRIAQISQKLEDQHKLVDQILEGLKHDRWTRQNEKIGAWLQEMFKKDTGNIHDTLRHQRTNDPTRATAAQYISDVTQWLKAGAPQIHWTRGSPGVGKSMATSALIDHIQSNLPEFSLHGLAFVYL